MLEVALFGVFNQSLGLMLIELQCWIFHMHILHDKCPEQREFVIEDVLQLLV